MTGQAFILTDVKPEEVFKLVDGRELHNLQELLEALKDMPSGVFSHHVNEQRNDFANWVKYSVGDSILADRIMDVKQQDVMYRLIHQRIEELKPAEKEVEVEDQKLAEVEHTKELKTETKKEEPTEEKKTAVKPTEIVKKVESFVERPKFKDELLNFMLALVIGFIIGLLVSSLYH